MLEVKKLTVGELTTNCYLLYNDKEAVVIDPADEASFIENIIADLDLTPKAVILTHGHFDHLLAALELSLAYKIPIFVNKKDKFLIERLDKTANYFTKQKDSLRPTATRNLTGKSKIVLGKDSLSIIEIPGHTPGSIAVYIKKHNIIFTGDLIFKGGSYGETRHAYSDKKAFDQSLKKILGLPPKTLVFPGHGEEFMVQSFRNA
jgi:glyoxylase-like metal-dependent hydrolase (beta-lactamase superfamily II)